MPQAHRNTSASEYALNEKGAFLIHNYNKSNAFCNFFPGVAGLWGIPMWVFYVNRGQCISSFGVESKDKAIMEFQPADKAYRMTSHQGFRTFMKVSRDRKVFFYEPFAETIANNQFVRSQEMAITSHDLTIEEINETLGLKVRVNYFTVPSENFASLVRDITITNLSSKHCYLDLVDGMPVIVPFGVNHQLQKDISRTVQAWNQVNNFKAKAPIYNLKVKIADRPEVETIEGGHFFFSLMHNGYKPKPLSVVIDPVCVFGSHLDYNIPDLFLKQKKFNVPRRQMSSNRSVSAMSHAFLDLPAKGDQRITSFFGHTHNIDEISQILAKTRKKDYIAKKSEENERIIKDIKNYCLTNSSSKALNHYCGQTFLDNVLRGGLPQCIEADDGRIVFNVYSRKHGDLERDYNYFVLAPTYLSQGNGNYRDVNQNRRNDVWFDTRVRESHILQFLNLLQADGYNPLVVQGTAFSIDSTHKIEQFVNEFGQGRGKTHLKKLLSKKFQPGQLLKTIEEEKIKLKVPGDEFLKRILRHCQKHDVARHGEGFWSDHWTYCLDLLERYFALYPEDKKKLFLEQNQFKFFYNRYHILPLDQRFVLTPRGVRQYHSVKKLPREMLPPQYDGQLRAKEGKGDVYFTNLFVKLLCTIVNKAATFDPSGVGIEMEGGKPNWYDALNGLPGLMGSSLNETLELKRWCLFVRRVIEDLDLKDHQELYVFEELCSLMSALHDLLATQQDDLSYWRRSNEVKEHYRRRILEGIDGHEKAVPISSIDKFLERVICKCDCALEKAKDSHGLLRTYFTHEVTQYDELERTGFDGCPLVHPLNFKMRALPLFLEGFVHAMRVQKDQIRARALYQKVRGSRLFDKKLKMYRCNDDLSGESPEIGRCHVFPPGWLENQSIWQHMQKKFLLELLRYGLYEEFFNNMKKTLIPFLNPKRYGRSILENSSFIVSSAHEDVKLHGKGFVARLSGTTAEWLHIWLILNAGETPFAIDQKGSLELCFKPILPGWMFTKRESVIERFDRNHVYKKMVMPKNTYAFHFLGTTLVVYHNPRRRDTFGKNKASIERILISYPDHRDPIHISGNCVPSQYALDIRNNKVNRIDVYMK